MNLPNYFLADLPLEATLTPLMITEACQTLKRNRERHLAHRSTAQLVKVISETAESWLQPDYPFRRLALEAGPSITGFQHATLARGLDAFFNELTRENFHALLVQELGHAHRLDEMSAPAAESKLGLAHIGAGNIPSPTLLSIVLGLLVRSAQFVKCSSGASFLPRLFAHSLYQMDPKLASCLELAEWRGGDQALDESLYMEAECVTATGSDETLASIRQRLPQPTRFLGYGHRVSFGYVARGALSVFGVKKLVARAVEDVIAWNQLGCLSPHLIYVEAGGAISPEQFAGKLAEELALYELDEPRGEIGVEDAAIIASRRDFYRVRAAASTDTQLWCSDNSTAWTVVYEADARFQLSCLNRFVYVKCAANLAEALRQAELVRGRVSTVGLAAPDDQAQALATELACWGVTRVCPLGQMQNPPLTWRHDGRPALGDLITWTDWEQ
jgi:Acyl-CoA reductase (LuxC)